MDLEKEIDDYTDRIYSAYASGYDVLFGIPADLKSSVRAIIKLTLQWKEGK